MFIMLSKREESQIKIIVLPLYRTVCIYLILFYTPHPILYADCRAFPRSKIGIQWLPIGSRRVTTARAYS